MTASILMPLARELPTANVFDAAHGLAQLLNAHVRATYIRPDPDVAWTMVPEMIVAAGVTRDVIAREAAEAAAAAKVQFEEWCNRHGGQAVVDRTDGGWSAIWSERVGEFEPIITRYGRLSDFIVLPRPSANEIVAQRCADAAIFGTGRPTLLVGGEPLPTALTEHILIAWNGSLEASRAAFGAAPLLRLAKRITIFTALEYGAEAVDLNDLAEALRERGSHAPEVVFPAGERSTGPALVTAAQVHQATLVVMGAYTHSRMREAFLGGVTKHLLAHAPVPLLLCH
jgi:nucleotide-binding universal stress UspA family protein